MIERSIMEAVQKADPGTEQEQLAKALLANYRGLRATGFKDIKPKDSEIPLELEANRLTRGEQIQSLLNMGCAEYLEMSPAEYDKSIPQFELSSKDTERFAGQIIIEERIPTEKFLKMLRITPEFRLDWRYISNWRGVRTTWYKEDNMRTGYTLLKEYASSPGKDRELKSPSVIEAANLKLQFPTKRYISIGVDEAASVSLLGRILKREVWEGGSSLSCR